MKVVSYPAVFYYDKDEDLYTAAIHDLELYVDGKTVEEAFVRAKSFLQYFLTCSQKIDEDVIPPSSFEAVSKNNKNLVMLIDVEV